MARAFIQVYGDEVVATELEAIGDRAKSLQPLWPWIFQKLEQIEEEQFATEGSRGGSTWEPLSRETLLRKFRTGQSLDILRATEALYDSLTGGASTHAVRTSGDDWAVFGSTLPQMNFQQDRPVGADYPERLPIDLTEQDRIEISQLMLEYIMGVRGRTGRVLPPRGAGGRFV